MRNYMVGWLSLEERFIGAFNCSARSAGDAVDQLFDEYFKSHPEADEDSIAVLFVAQSRARSEKHALVEFLQHTPLYPFLGTDVYPNVVA